MNYERRLPTRADRAKDTAYITGWVGKRQADEIVSNGTWSHRKPCAIGIPYGNITANFPLPMSTYGTIA